MKTFVVTAIIILALILGVIGPTIAAEEGNIELIMVAEREIEITNPDGSTIVQRVPADKVIPGDDVIYTITYANKGAEPAENVVVNNPIPVHMVYVGGSATGENCVITFSVDKGKSFDLPEKLLTKDAKGNLIKASAAAYTNIRWTLNNPVPSMAIGTVSFKARLE